MISRTHECENWTVLFIKFWCYDCWKNRFHCWFLRLKYSIAFINYNPAQIWHKYLPMIQHSFKSRITRNQNINSLLDYAVLIMQSAANSIHALKFWKMTDILTYIFDLHNKLFIGCEINADLWLCSKVRHQLELTLSWDNQISATYMIESYHYQ